MIIRGELNKKRLDASKLKFKLQERILAEDFNNQYIKVKIEILLNN
jgi:hypothetical protein